MGTEALHAEWIERPTSMSAVEVMDADLGRLVECHESACLAGSSPISGQFGLPVGHHALAVGEFVQVNRVALSAPEHLEPAMWKAFVLTITEN
jgi:hypothetical protein